MRIQVNSDDEKGHPMLGFALVGNLKFQEHVVAETRALLEAVQAW